MLKFQKTTALAVLSGIALLTMIHADAAGSSKVVTTAAQPVLNVITSALPKTPSADVRVLTATLAPGYSTFWHTHPSPPFIYVESGTATWEYKGGRSPDTRHAGQAIMEPANVIMRIANRGTTSVSVVIFQVSKPGEPRILPAP